MSGIAAGQVGRKAHIFDPEVDGELAAPTRALIGRRADLLGPAYKLFYKDPVHLVRGSGTRLWDADGVEYLDCYNNVASVGHANPVVVDAVHQQMQMLCTNTRYLHEAILDYSEMLRATFDGPLTGGHVMLTCTGSEANDLALRIAKRRTGHRGIIVMRDAYHGNTESVEAISPKIGAPMGTWVRSVPTPDSYRLDAVDLSRRFAPWVQEQIDELHRHGEGLAAFIVEPSFFSAGIFVDPVDLLGPVAEVVHRAGGLFITDEVQSGFARTGEKLWGHQRHGVEPDLVTLGKPMGNGFPVGGVVATRDAMGGSEPGQRPLKYFNTFGGNPVAVAAAQATFAEIQDRDLLRNTAEVGAELRSELYGFRDRFEGIGDVRGVGLVVGLDIVSDRGTKTPDPATAGAIVNGLRQRGVLVGAAGPHGNVVKLRPPLVFSSADVDRFLSAFDDVLSALAPGQSAAG